MPEIYEPWNPPLPEYSHMTFDSVIFSTENFSIDLKNRSRNLRGKLVFQEPPLLIKITNESYRLKSMRKLPESGKTFYIVHESELMREFHEDSLGIYEKYPILHFVIATEEWIDLVLSELPAFELAALS